MELTFFQKMSNAWIKRHCPKPAIRSTTVQTKVGKEITILFYQARRSNQTHVKTLIITPSLIDLDNILQAFTLCEKLRENQKNLQHAGALASRLIARRANSFRMQPCFTYFRKMNIALCRLKEINIYEDCVEMKKAIGVAKTAYKLDNAFYFPAKENFEHFLAGFQSYAKLLTRISMCAREAHKYYLELIHRSAFIESLSLFMAVSSNIWSICVDLCKCSVTFYNNFFPLYMQIYGATADFPCLLNEWIGDDYKAFIDTDIAEIASNSSKDLFLFDENNEAIEITAVEQKFEPKLLVKRKLKDKSHREDQPRAKIRMFETQDLLEERTFKIVPKANNEANEKMSTNNSSQSGKWSVQSFDLGEKISRTNGCDVGEKISRSSVNEVEIVKQIDVDKLKSITDIREFLATEEQLRDKKKARNTQGISDDDWGRFENSTNQILILGHPGLVMKKFKQSWQQLMRKIKK